MVLVPLLHLQVQRWAAAAAAPSSLSSQLHAAAASGLSELQQVQLREVERWGAARCREAARVGAILGSTAVAVSSSWMQRHRAITCSNCNMLTP